MSEMAETGIVSHLVFTLEVGRNTIENFQLKLSLSDDVMLSRAKWNNVKHALFTS